MSDQPPVICAELEGGWNSELLKKAAKPYPDLANEFEKTNGVTLFITKRILEQLLYVLRKVRGVEGLRLRFRGLELGVGHDFSNLILEELTFHNCQLVQVGFAQSDVGTFLVVESTMEDTSMKGLTVDRGQFRDCRLTKTDLAESNWGYVTWKDTLMHDADFRKVSNGLISFQDATLEGVKRLGQVTRPDLVELDRGTVLRLGSDRGGLTDHDLSVIRVEDDLAELRSQFMGLSRTLHWGAILFFVMPYLVFLVNLWLRTVARTEDATGDLPVWEAVLRYLANGGARWQEGWFPNFNAVGVLSLLLSYNLLRITCFIKVDRLEVREKAFGVKPEFSFLQAWHGVEKMTRTLPLDMQLAGVTGTSKRQLYVNMARIRARWLIAKFRTWGGLFLMLRVGGYLVWILTIWNIWHFSQQKVSLFPF